MRLSEDSSNQTPSWLIALVVFIVLVAVVNIFSRQGPVRPLEQQFAASPPAADAGQLELPPLPTNLVALARTTTARVLGGQSGAPLTPVKDNGNLQVTIEGIKSENGGLHITGAVSNIGTTPVDVSLDAFKFTDETGTVYAASGGGNTTLQPRQQAPLDITLPIAKPTQLKLDVAPPNQTPIEMILLQQAAQ